MSALTVQGRPFAPDPAALLGQGGEACVYRWQGLAVKVHHDAGPAAMAERRARLDALAALALPPAVVRPLAPLLDEGGGVRGFAMPLIDGATPARLLSRRAWREANMGHEAALAALRGLADALDALHAKGLAVGDLNEGNLLLTGLRPHLIDVDSLHLPGHPCRVAHERFLDPRLLGQDLAAAPRFNAETDWYAFAVLLFGALLWMHPYGGVHAGLPTLLRRAEAGHSALRPDVRRPACAAPPEALPPELLAWFEGVFDRGLRGRPPQDLLALRFWRCGCGLEVCGPRCPKCRHDTKFPISVVKSCNIESHHLRALPGPLLARAWRGGLELAWLEGDRVQREDGRAAAPWTPGARVWLAGELTWLHGQGRARAWRGGSLVMEADAESFAAAPGVAVAARGDELLELHSGLRLGLILRGQTRLWCDEALGYAFYQAGRLTHHLLFRPRRPGLTPLDLPPWEGRLLDVEVLFDEDRLLVAGTCERAGRAHVRLHLLDGRGRLLAERSGDPELDPLLTAPRALRGDALLLATPAALVVLTPRGGRLEPARRFPCDPDLLPEGAGLDPGPGGSLTLFTPGELRRISLSPQGA